MRRRSTCNRLPAAASSFTFTPQVTVSALIDSALVPPRAALAEGPATVQLAEDMRRQDGITRDDLIVLGWTPDQLDALAGRARTRAQRLAGASV